jgi:hypothetical protein
MTLELSPDLTEDYVTRYRHHQTREQHHAS